MALAFSEWLNGDESEFKKNSGNFPDSLRSFWNSSFRPIHTETCCNFKKPFCGTTHHKHTETCCCFKKRVWHHPPLAHRNVLLFQEAIVVPPTTSTPKRVAARPGGRVVNNPDISIVPRLTKALLKALVDASIGGDQGFFTLISTNWCSRVLFP